MGGQARVENNAPNKVYTGICYASRAQTIETFPASRCTCQERKKPGIGKPRNPPQIRHKNKKQRKH
eukprot:5693990-Amphidinium_carterae.1